MSTVEASKNTPTKNRTKDKEREREKEKEKERKQRASQKVQTERLKTVVRRLPPNLPENIFWKSVEQWVSDDTVVWKSYYQGKFRKRLNKENIPSRAYIAFKNQEFLAMFSRDYDGHVFRDKAGNESIAIVEFAPYQKIPSATKKVDSRINTIDQDEDYISFLESLKESTVKPVDVETLDALVANSQPAPQPTTTPLLEALKAEKQAQKEKENMMRIQQRTQAHYKIHEKESAAAASGGARGGKKEESKKAQAANQQPSKPSEQVQSKRSAKKAAANAKTQQQNANQPAPAKSQASASSHPQKTQIIPTKPRRERGGSKGAASAPQASANATSSTASGTSSNMRNSNATSQGQVAATPGTTDTAAPPPRRTRPVIGLASRQFEAALSGAVGSRPRRERENKDAPSPSVATPVEANPPRTNVPPVPTLLQRETPAQLSNAASAGAQSSSAAGDTGSGLRGDDRGRGRGRGGRGRGRGGRGG